MQSLPQGFHLMGLTIWLYIIFRMIDLISYWMMQHQATLSILWKKMLENYKGFEGVSTLVDVTGNTGINPNIKDAPTYRGTTRPFLKEKNMYLLYFDNIGN